MNIITVGIIGQGHSGRGIHAESLESPILRERFRVLGVADSRPDRCRETRDNQPGCRAYTDYREMLKDRRIDLIVNATQTPDHVPVSLEALDAGFDVLCEKPLTRSVADVDRLAAAAKRAGKTFAVFQQSRFAPAFRKIQDVIASGRLGRVMLVKLMFNGFVRRWDWQTMQSMGGGNLANMGPHPLDQALQLMGDVYPERILCTLEHANSFGDADDHAKVVLAAEGYPTVDLETSSCCLIPPPVYQIYGTHGTLSGSHKELEWRFFLPEEAPNHTLETEPLEGRAYCTENLAFYNECWTCSDEGMRGNARTERFYVNLYDALTGRAPLEVTLEHIRRQVAVLEECFKQNPAFNNPAAPPSRATPRPSARTLAAARA